MTTGGLFDRIRAACLGRKSQPTDYQRAQALIAAIDAGGIPLNTIRINAIARGLGLDVPSTAPVETTVARIRIALQRQAPPAPE